MKGRSNEEIGDYIHFYSGVGKGLRAKRGVSIAIHKNLKEGINRWEEIDEQIIMLEINKNGQNIVIVGVSVPSNEVGVSVPSNDDAETRDSSYIQLENVLSKVRKVRRYS
ncbi:hypothetical protein HHI36_015705 [Cryptolaemus montrouzieri]|uniref:Uncharacterized protein n=1 Tax=Cryptolaemus montrouzieri TaxID=559131 RepID=A0ABD2N6I9_9CUCU